MNSANIALTPLKLLADQLERWVKGRLWLKVLIALAAGVLLGIILGPDMALIDSDSVAVITVWLALPGQIFLALIQMIVVPLVIASIVRGLAANNDPKALRTIGGYAIAFILFTTAVATATGISIGNIIEPGSYVDARLLNEGDTTSAAPGAPVPTMPSMQDIPDKLLTLLPKNPMASMVSGEMLQVILFAAVLGFALLSIPPKQAAPLFELLGALQEVSIRVVSWAMLLAPLAVFGLITKLVANLGVEVLTGMLMYVLTVLLGLGFIALLYLLLIRIVTKSSPRRFLADTRELLLLAFSTSSSAAVMPTSLQLTENVLKVRPGIARFLIPLGATINMTGTALYQGVATVFLAQVFGIELGFSSYVFVITMAVAASIGSPATPGAGIVILSIVLQGVGIPPAGIALLLGVDRILDMCRTTINVLGDVVICCLLDKVLPPDSAHDEPVVSPATE